MSTLFALHETMATPEPVMLLGVIEPQVRPGCGAPVRVTSPVNPLRLVMLIVDDTGAPTAPVGDEANSAKSWKLKVAVVV